MNDDYIGLNTGSAGYISGAKKTRRKHPIGFTAPGVQKRQPRSVSAKAQPRARVTKSRSPSSRTRNKR